MSAPLFTRIMQAREREMHMRRRLRAQRIIIALALLLCVLSVLLGMPS